jgi:hypothetical protein
MEAGAHTKKLQVTKGLAKKLKLGKDAAEAVVLRFVEAQLAFDYRDKSQLPIKLDEKIGNTHEVLNLVDEQTFNKEHAEHLVAFLKSVAPTELTAVCYPCQLHV